jgi:glycosyltransferase involved in cell wall biosynthesis
LPVLVHDYLLVHRGAERCFLTLCDMFPGAPVSTLLYDPDVFAERLAGHEVRTSRLQRLGRTQDTFKPLLPVLPAAASRLPVTGHDLVLSSSSAFAHGVVPDEGATHVCYCYTPFRYAWYEQERALAEAPRWARTVVGATLRGIRRWDSAKAARDTRYVAISEISRHRIRRYWGRDAEVVYPPVELHRFSEGEPDDAFLFVGELVRHKNVEVALAAAERAGAPIRIVGGGSDEARLRARYGSRPGVAFLGRVDDALLAELYAGSRALVVPNVEEFGITVVEAQASGRPVLAADGGGARETVIDGVTGLFHPLHDVAALSAAMRDPALSRMQPQDAVANAQRFSPDVFRSGMRGQIDAARSGVNHPPAQPSVPLA